MTFLTVGGLLHGLSETETQEFARLCTNRRDSAGKTIFPKGDPADSLYILREGFVRPVPHRHLVFALPKILRPAFRNRRRLLPKLALCVWKALPAAIVSIQTAGEVPQLASPPACKVNILTVKSCRPLPPSMATAALGHPWPSEAAAGGVPCREG